MNTPMVVEENASPRVGGTGSGRSEPGSLPGRSTGPGLRPEDLLPHRPPFLFVDEILELEPGRRAVACWRPSPDAEWVPAHFPGHPLVPGVLLVEALAQSGALAVLADPAKRGMLPVFAGLDRVRFRRPVRPGETVHLEVEILQARRTTGRGHAVARVGDKTAVEAEMLFVLLREGDPGA